MPDGQNHDKRIERLIAGLREWYQLRGPAFNAAQNNDNHHSNSTTNSSSVNSPDPTELGVVYSRREDGHDATYAEPAEPLHPLLAEALQKQKITQLYSHQAEAIDNVRAGKHLALVTPTASGKTLCFNLPVLETCIEQWEKASTNNKRPVTATALYIFPVNALLNDQYTTLNNLIGQLGQAAPHIRAARYSGALSKEEKQQVRKMQPNILLTNPEIVNLSLLGWHSLWADFYRNLKYIVVDEVHTYRGVFGSHIAHLLRRLRRVCAHYGSNPQFICCSATIGNPLELVSELIGLPEDDFHLIPPERNGAYRSPRHYALVSPPPYHIKKEPVNFGLAVPKPGTSLTTDVPLYRPTSEEAADLTTWLLAEAPDMAMLCFARARQQAETMLRLCRADLRREKAEQVIAYRAGLLAQERVAIERGLKEGKLRAVFSTNALELGIDIGGLDAVIMAGYPGSQMAMRQQAGRAGRGQRAALVVLMATRNPLDQYYMRNPVALFDSLPEKAYINPLNGHVATAHLLAAAKELPLSEADLDRYYPPAMRSWVRKLAKGEADEKAIGSLREGRDSKGQRVWRFAADSDVSPQFHINLRSSSNQTFIILNRDTGREVGTIEPPAVYREAHPGAIYAHAGDTYRVDDLDEQRRRVIVYPVGGDESTETISETDVNVVKVAETAEHNFGKAPRMAIKAGWGWLVAHEVISGYRLVGLQRRRQRMRVPGGYDEREREQETFFETPYRFEVKTTGMWMELPPHQAFGPIGDYEGGIQALENILSSLFPVQIMCDRQDIGSAYALNDELGATIYFYDNYEGGAGLAAAHYHKIYELLDAAYIAILKCSCRDGCPSCVQAGRYSSQSDRTDKRAALRILARLLARNE